MEIFMDKIIQADKKARRIIEMAQKEREQIINKYIEEADKDMELRKQAQMKKMASQDERIQDKEKIEMSRADNEYINAKHKMDEVFNAGIDNWENDIIKAVLK